MVEDRSPEGVLEEILAWTKFGYRREFIVALNDALKDGQQFRAYESTDGTRNQAEVAAIAGLSQQGVSYLWAKWRRLGLVVSVGTRMKHLQRPSDLGIEPPPDTQRRKGD